MKVNRQKLLDVCNTVKPALPKDDYIPILKHICFDGEGVYAYNDILGIYVQEDIDIEIEGGIPGDVLIKYLSSVKTEEVELVDSDDGMKIKSGRSHINMVKLPSDDFIFEVPEELSEFYVTLSQEFVAGLKLCLISVSDDAGHPEHNGIILNVTDGAEIELLSTDNYSISKFIYDCEDYNLLAGSILMPRQFCEQLINLYSSLDAVNLYIEEDYIFASDEDGKYIIYSKLLYKDSVEGFDSVLEKHTKSLKTSFKINENLIDALNRCMIVLGNQSNKTTKGVLKGNILNLEANGTSIVKEQVKFISKNASNKTIDLKIPTDLLLRSVVQCDQITFGDDVILLKKDDFIHLIAQSN